MSQTQQQPPQPKVEQQPARPRIARISFVNAISFAGTIESATSDPGQAAVTRLGAGVDIRPAKVAPNGEPRELREGETLDGYRLSRTDMDRAANPPRRVLRVAFVPLQNVKEVTISTEA